MRRRWAVILGILVMMIGGTGISRAREGAVPVELIQQAQARGMARVIVQIDVPFQPEGNLDGSQAVASQQQVIAAAQNALLAELVGTTYRITRQFQTIPFAALEVGTDALTALEQSRRVLGVEEDRPVPPLLSESMPLIEADLAHAASFDGSGQAVAILDTGVDTSHPFFGGRVVAEACFSGNSNCPNGGTTQTGPGAGVNCTYTSGGCQHGTHVAGIAAGSGPGFTGVANKASIIAVQIFSRFAGADCLIAGEDPCALTFSSDQIAGLEYVFSLRSSFQIASVNMSLGGGQFFDQATCDAQNAATKAAIDNLRSVEIATVIASGNLFLTDSMSAPGCISTAISVGSTTKADAVSDFSNSASFLKLLAPGSNINSSVPGGGFGFKSGTSMATPHVTGAWAILKQKAPAATVDQVLNALQTTGLPIQDSRNGLTFPRIRVMHALNALGGGQLPPTFTLTLTGCTSCRAGNHLIVQAHVTNPGSRDVLVEAKIGVRLPDGTPVNLTGNKHLEVTLPAGLDSTFIFDIPLPAGLPTGTWNFEGTLLEPELGKTFSREVKPFQVVP